MTKTHMQDMVDFHEKFDLAYNGKPRALPKELADFRFGFLKEELHEYKDATHILDLELNTEGRPHDPGMVTATMEDQLDAMVDLAYVLFGTAYLHGYADRWQEAWDRVHAANMAKVRATDASQSARGSTLDVVKPKGWVKPTHVDLVEDNIHNAG